MIATITNPVDTSFIPGPPESIEQQTLPTHISPSAAKSYLSCSLRFWFERVACIPKPTSPALQLGKVVHAALQSFHVALWRGTDHSRKAVEKAFYEAFERLEREDGPAAWTEKKTRDKAIDDGLRVVLAYLDSPDVLTERPKAVEVFLTEEIDGLSVPLTGAMDLVRGDLTPVDFKSAAAKPDPETALFDHELQLVSYQLMIEHAIGVTPPFLELMYLVKTKVPQVIKVVSPPADRQRKQRVVAMLETAVIGISNNRHHPQPGMHCSWCQFRNECLAWLPGMDWRSQKAA